MRARGYGQALQFAAAEAARRAAQKVIRRRQARIRQRLARGRLQRRRVQPALNGQRLGHGLEHRKVRGHGGGGVLGHESQAAQAVAGRAAGAIAGQAGHFNRSGIGAQQAGQNARERGFARAAGAGDGHGFAALHAQRGAAQHGLAASALVQAVRGQHGHDAAAQAGHAVRIRRGALLQAALDALAAPVGKGAAAGAVLRLAGNALQVFAAFARPGAQQAARVGVARRGQHTRGGAGFHHAAAIEHQRLALQRAGQLQIVRHNSQPPLPRFGAQPPQHQIARGCVQRRSGFVQHQQLRLRRQRHGQQRALELAAAALSGVARVQAGGQIKRGQQISGGGAGLPRAHGAVQAQRLGHLIQQGVLQVEHTGRVLQGDAGAPPAPGA